MGSDEKPNLIFGKSESVMDYEGKRLFSILWNKSEKKKNIIEWPEKYEIFKSNLNRKYVCKTIVLLFW